jgi:hypothetical protein
MNAATDTLTDEMHETVREPLSMAFDEADI